MKTRLILSYCTTLLLLTLATTTTAAPRPNIVFIISDDHRWDALGAAGNPNIETPNLDRMAKEGLHFKQGTIHISTCSPSRATLLTGVPPHQHGWYSNEAQRAEVVKPDGFAKFKLMPKVLQDAGYHTAHAGKWHLTPEPWNCGFETITKWMLGGAGPYKDPRLATGKTRELKKVPGFTQTIFANEAIAVMKKHAAEETTRPLFLWLAMTAPHGSFVPNPEPFSGMYKGKTAHDLAPTTYHGDRDTTAILPKVCANYYEAITALDHEVGRVLTTIETNDKLATNTLVVFMGDNGFMMGSRGLRGKYVPFDESLRVPMIAWGAKSVLGASGETSACVNSLDLPPTFAKLAGAEIPKEWAGRDATAVLKDGKPNGLDWSVSEYVDPRSEIEHVQAYRAIRTPTSKLVIYHPTHNEPNAVYDLVTDPGEKNNLYEKPEGKAIRETLEPQLANWRDKTSDTTWDMTEPVIDFERASRGVDSKVDPNERGVKVPKRNQPKD